MSTEILIKQLLDSIKAEIIESQSQKGMVASGGSARSLETSAEELSGQITGVEYFRFQEFGRAPGKQPPIDSIEKWITDKRLNVPEKWTIRGFAYVIARKIGREGSRIYRDKSLGIPITQIINENLDKFEEKLSDSLFDTIAGKITDALK